MMTGLNSWTDGLGPNVFPAARGRGVLAQHIGIRPCCDKAFLRSLRQPVLPIPRSAVLLTGQLSSALFTVVFGTAQLSHWHDGCKCNQKELHQCAKSGSSGSLKQLLGNLASCLGTWWTHVAQRLGQQARFSGPVELVKLRVRRTHLAGRWAPLQHDCLGLLSHA